MSAAGMAGPEVEDAGGIPAVVGSTTPLTGTGGVAEPSWEEPDHAKRRGAGPNRAAWDSADTDHGGGRQAGDRLIVVMLIASLAGFLLVLAWLLVAR